MKKIVQKAIRDSLDEFTKEFAHFNDNVLFEDYINISSGAKDSWFSHIAIEVPVDNLSTELLDKVNDEQYNKLK